MIPLEYRTTKHVVALNGRYVETIWERNTGELLRAEYIHVAKPETTYIMSLAVLFIERRNWHLDSQLGRPRMSMRQAEERASKDLDTLLEEF